MSSEMGQQQPNLHGSVQVLREADREPAALARERGWQWPLFGPHNGSAIDVHLIELAPGGPAGHYHRHPQSENVYLVLSGTLALRHPGGTVTLHAGDAARIPAGVAHGAAIEGSEPCRLLEFYAPLPADFVLVDEGDHASPTS